MGYRSPIWLDPFLSFLAGLLAIGLIGWMLPRAAPL
jgi:hypothetical protein